MTRISTNVMALNAYQHLTVTNDRLATSLERLSSGYRINRAGDDPSGLVQSTVLAANVAATDQAIDNVTRASNMFNTADGALEQIGNLLLQVRDEALNASNSTGLSSEELDTSQDAVDSAVDSINRIAQMTSFGNAKLLNGSLDFLIDNITPAKSIDRVYVFQGPLSAADNTLSFKVTASAERAKVSIGAFTSLAADEIWEITGNLGSKVFAFTGGATNAVVLSTINASKDETGVIAKTSGGTTYLASLEFGSDQFIQANNIGSGAQFSGTLTDDGKDVEGSIMGHQGRGTGLTLRVNGDQMDIEIRFAKPDYTTAANWSSGPTSGTGSFLVRARGGTKLQLGPDPISGQQLRVGLSLISSGSLGSNTEGRLYEIVTGGQYDLRTNPSQAVKIVDEAISFVAKVRGKIGALDKDTLQPTASSLGVASENLQAALGDILDTDFAKEAAELIRDQIMAAIGTNVFSTANLTPSNVLALLS